jgi:hypothetical protein
MPELSGMPVYAQLEDEVGWDARAAVFGPGAHIVVTAGLIGAA